MNEAKRSAVGVAIVAACLVAAGHGLYRLARSRTTQLFGTLVPRVDTAQRVVALTFDDGPTMDRVDDIVAMLEARRVKATFFVIGAELAKAPEAGHRLVAAGHELGDHTYSHKHMVLKSPSFIRSELERTDALIRAAGERGEIYFRPPFAWKLVGLPWLLWRTGRTTITWDIEPESQGQVAASSERLVAHVLERVRPGSIILLHVWYPARETSRAAVPMIIDGLHTRGYRFVTVGGLLRTASRP